MTQPHDSTAAPPVARIARPGASGLLPPWGEAPLPSPPPFTLRQVLRTIGPGVIGLGLAIGSGEWLLGPSIVVTYGPALLWITTVALVLQTVLNLEMARYTLYTGEPVMTGFMRTRPGPGFWGWTYSVLSFLQYGWPGWALASATATAALLLGRMPTADDAGTVVTIGYATFGLCFLLVLVGRKVERSVELAMSVMVAFVIVYLLLVDLATVSGETWAAVLTGFVSVGAWPDEADWVLIGAFAAYSGIGGVGNAYVTNWLRDKGYGMGGTVGYIPALFGPRVRLSPQGNVFAVTPDSVATWRRWWKFLHVDQWGIFALGSLVGMALTVLLTMEYVPPGSTIDGWAVANQQALGMARAHGSLFWGLTLVCGFWVLFSTQLAIVDGLPRAITDMLWSGSPLARRWRGGDVRGIYYGVLAVFAVWGCLGLNLAQPLTLIIIGANIAGFNCFLLAIHTFLLNRRVLPRELRPSRLREALLLMCALFYGGFAAIVLIGTF